MGISHFWLKNFILLKIKVTVMIRIIVIPIASILLKLSWKIKVSPMNA